MEVTRKCPYHDYAHLHAISNGLRVIFKFHKTDSIGVPDIPYSPSLTSLCGEKLKALKNGHQLKTSASPDLRVHGQVQPKLDSKKEVSSKYSISSFFSKLRGMKKSDSQVRNTSIKLLNLKQSNGTLTDYTSKLINRRKHHNPHHRRLQQIVRSVNVAFEEAVEDKETKKGLIKSLTSSLRNLLFGKETDKKYKGNRTTKGSKKMKIEKDHKLAKKKRESIINRSLPREVNSNRSEQELLKDPKTYTRFITQWTWNSSRKDKSELNNDKILKKRKKKDKQKTMVSRSKSKHRKRVKEITERYASEKKEFNYDELKRG